MEYLRIPIQDEWSLDGLSRIEWAAPPATPTEQCDLSRAAPAIALSGGYIFNGVDAEHLDTSAEEALDQCLSETTEFGRFHYRSWSHCASSDGSAPSDQAPGHCDEACAADPTSFAVSQGLGEGADYRAVVGLARDGHLVYGPYNSNGDLWSCSEHDICNGAFMEDGSYAYVSTAAFPYVASCWGPAAAACPDDWCIGPFYAMHEYAMYLIGLALIIIFFWILCCVCPLCICGCADTICKKKRGPEAVTQVTPQEQTGVILDASN